jgi:hypothetical protein
MNWSPPSLTNFRPGWTQTLETTVRKNARMVYSSQMGSVVKEVIHSPSALLLVKGVAPGLWITSSQAATC